PSWLERLAPDLDYGVARFPDVDPDGPPTANIGGNPVCIPRESRHPDAAWTFISWLQTRDAQLEFARGIHNLPNRIDMLAYPILASFYYSLTDYAVLRPPRWIGLANYAYLLREDEYFWHFAVYNTLFMFLELPLSIALGVGLAMLLNQRLRGMAVFRTIFYVPVLVPT